MRIFSFTASLLLGVVVATATATASAAPPEAVMQTDGIRSQQAQITLDVVSGKGVYKDLPPASRGQLLSRQARVMELIDGKQSTAELDDVGRVELFAALASIDAMVSKASDGRLVCQHVKTVGSNRKERVCRTVGHLRAERDAARNQADSSRSQATRNN